MEGSLKDELVSAMVRIGAFQVRVADPRQGFELSPPERHPLKLMPDCRSVVSFVVPRAAPVANVRLGIRRHEALKPDWGNSTYLRPEDAPCYYMREVTYLFVANVIATALSLLAARGWRALSGQSGPWMAKPAPDKVCAYEAGLGVYGRSGLILHPVLGNRIAIGVVLTDAELKPDGRLDGFDPCRGCDACIRACPVQAYGDEGQYHGVWSFDKCWSAHEFFGKRRSYCQRCFESCKRCTVAEGSLFLLSGTTREAMDNVKRMAESAGDWFGYSDVARAELLDQQGRQECASSPSCLRSCHS